MQLIEIFLPLSNNEGLRFSSDYYAEVRKTLTEKFGGLTAFTRAPAEGREKGTDHERSDELIIFEVMVEEIDRCWWSGYRRQLQQRFEQERILIRVSSLTLL